MIGMNTYPQSHSHIEPPTKLEPGHTPFQLVYGLHIHYYLQNTCYHLNLMKTEIHNLLKF
jgi:hypothetical protein